MYTFIKDDFLFFLLDGTLRGGIAAILALLIIAFLGKQIRAAGMLWIWAVVMALFVFIPLKQTYVNSLKFNYANIQEKANPEINMAKAHNGQKVLSDENISENMTAALSVQKTTVTAKNSNIVSSPKTSQPFITFEKPDWKSLFIICWATGFAIMLLCFLTANHQCSRRLRKFPEIKDSQISALFDDCRELLIFELEKGGFLKKLAIRNLKKAKLIDGGHSCSPAVYGISTPRIIIPAESVSLLGTESAKLIILHELCHVAGHHILLSTIGFIIKSVHWFNPLVHIAYRRLIRSLEALADMSVLRISKDVQNANYAETIIKMLELSMSPKPITGMGMAEDKSGIKKRMEMISMFRKNNSFYSAALACVMVAGLVAVSSFTGCKNSSERETTKNFDKEQEAILQEFAHKAEPTLIAPKILPDNSDPAIKTLLRNNLEKKLDFKIIAVSTISILGKTEVDNTKITLTQTTPDPVNLNEGPFIRKELNNTNHKDFSRSLPYGEYEIKAEILLFGSSNFKEKDLTLSSDELKKLYPSVEIKIPAQKIERVKSIPKDYAKPIQPTPEMTEAIKKSLSFYFTRSEQSLCLTGSIKNSPENIAFTVEGKRERGTGDKWEAVMTLACYKGDSSTHHSVFYKLFSGLDGGKNYKFKFRLVPNARLATNSPQDGCLLDSYYNGTVETDWIDIFVPAQIKASDNDVFKKYSDLFSVLTAGETVRNDELFEKGDKDFYIKPLFGDEYWINGGGFSDNEIETRKSYNPEAPYAFSLIIAEFESLDANGKSLKAYAILPYRLYNNTGFGTENLGLAKLFPEPGDYKLKSNFNIYSVSGDDLIKEGLANKGSGTPFLKNTIRAVRGVLNSGEAPGLIEKLKVSYPYKKIELPEQNVKAVMK